MFRWLAKYIRRIDVWGIGVELREPQPESPTPLASRPSTGALRPALPAPPSPVPASPPPTLAGDRAAFLREVERLKGPAARADCERVLDDLISWSEAQGGLLTFRPRPAANTQATITYCFRGKVFWDAWPQQSPPTKFIYEYKAEREYLLGEFAKLSGGGVPASPKLPTMAFRDLISDATRQRLKELLSEVLANLTRGGGLSPKQDS